MEKEIYNVDAIDRKNGVVHISRKIKGNKNEVKIMNLSDVEILGFNMLWCVIKK